MTTGLEADTKIVDSAFLLSEVSLFYQKAKSKLYVTM